MRSTEAIGIMIYSLKPYWDVILAERTWSWSLIGILYLLSGFLVRSWFIQPLTSCLKQITRDLQQEVKKAYLRHSFWGWFFFLIPLGLFILLWRSDLLPFRLDDRYVVLAALLSFIFSLILHLQAFAKGALLTLKRSSELHEKKMFEA